MVAKRKPKEENLQALIEQKILDRLKKDDCTRGDIDTAIKFLEMKEKRGEGYGKGFQAPHAPEDGEEPDLPYSPSPLERLPAEGDPEDE